MLVRGRKWPALGRSVVLAGFLSATVITLTYLTIYPSTTQVSNLFDNTQPDHTIDHLIRNADDQHDAVVNSETYSLAAAAQAYRVRRGRHPPAGFDLWYYFVKKSGSPVIESFFDQIYEDMEPFWSVPSKQLRHFAETWPTVLSVRNGTVNVREPVPNLWMGFWQGMLDGMPPLPDVDLAVMTGDDPRVMVPFDAMKVHMMVAEQSKLAHNQIPLTKMKQDFAQHPAMSADIPVDFPAHGLTVWSNGRAWDEIVRACRPEDPARQHPELVPPARTPPVHSTTYTAGTIKGYVSNVTMARNVCHNPNLRTLHGFIIEPFTKSVYTELRPVFTVNKLAGVGNDILIPPPTHWVNFGAYAGSDHTSPWKSKKNATVWRGIATGGNNNPQNWWGFHRHRFLHVLNGTLQTNLEHELKSAGPHATMQTLQDNPHFDWGSHNIPFPNPKLYNLAALSYGKLGKWISKITNAGFVALHCSRLAQYNGQKTCAHTSPYYSIAEYMNTTEMMTYKYLPDVDGHVASGRFLGFVRSLGVPIKSSIFTEWHDRRLIPWRHYVPLSAEYQEWWGLMQYFLGYQGDKGELSVRDHDHVGEKIGRQGNEWAHHVERSENLLAYFYRVILEFARVSADERVEMGFVQDLLRWNQTWAHGGHHHS